MSSNWALALLIIALLIIGAAIIIAGREFLRPEPRHASARDPFTHEPAQSWAEGELRRQLAAAVESIEPAPALEAILGRAHAEADQVKLLPAWVEERLSQHHDNPEDDWNSIVRRSKERH